MPAGTKRTPVDAVGPACKRFAGKGSAADESLMVVSKMIEEHDDLHPMVRAMLMDMLPHCLGVQRGDRHSFQNDAVEAVAGVVKSIQNGMKDGIAEQQSKIAAGDEIKEDRARVVASVEETLEGKKKDVAEVKAALASAARAFKAAKIGVVDATTDLNSGADEASQAAVKKDLLEATMKDSMQPLCSGLLPAEVRKEEASKLVSLLKERFEFDESLTRALPQALSFMPDVRGQFDRIVVEQLQAEVASRLEELASASAAAKESQEGREASVFSAEVTLKGAKEKQKQCANRFKDEMNEQSNIETSLVAAKKQLRDLGPEMKKIGKSVENLQKRLSAFEDGPLLAFEQLRDTTEPAAPADKAEGSPEGCLAEPVNGDAPAEAAGSPAEGIGGDEE